MKRLHVAVLTKAVSENRFHPTDRTWGCWSHPVDEFTFDILPASRGEVFTLGDLRLKGYDMVVVEDGCWPILNGDAIPSAFYCVDSTVSVAHYNERHHYAKGFGLTLLDHDRAHRFKGIPCAPFPHCVNTHVFRNRGYERTVDVGIHINVGGPCCEDRKVMKRVVSDWAIRHKIPYLVKIAGVVEYGEMMARDKIVVNWPRCFGNRSHRVLDAMGSGACVVTGPIPYVRGEDRWEGRDYVEVANVGAMLQAIAGLLSSGRWLEKAEEGYDTIQKFHTWNIRATQLRSIINEKLDL